MKLATALLALAFLLPAHACAVVGAGKLGALLLMVSIGGVAAVNWPGLADRWRGRAERRRKIHELALYPDYKDGEPDA